MGKAYIEITSCSLSGTYRVRVTRHRSDWVNGAEGRVKEKPHVVELGTTELGLGARQGRGSRVASPCTSSVAPGEGGICER